MKPKETMRKYASTPDLGRTPKPSRRSVEADIRRYARSKEAQSIRRDRRVGIDREAAELVEFAQIWAPFGGAPADEIFVRFGMSRAQFTRRLADMAEDLG